MERGEPFPDRPQDEAAATTAPPIRKEEGAIDWTRPPAAIDAKSAASRPPTRDASPPIPQRKTSASGGSGLGG